MLSEVVTWPGGHAESDPKKGSAFITSSDHWTQCMHLVYGLYTLVLGYAPMQASKTLTANSFSVSVSCMSYAACPITQSAQSVITKCRGSNAWVAAVH